MTKDPDHGSPAATVEYRRNAMRELAEDQYRRGLTMDGMYDPLVVRCCETSPEGGHCTLRAGHGAPLYNDVLTTPHERCADTTRPREIAEVWEPTSTPESTTVTVPRHFTAWLVNISSCLDQPNCDLTVIEDELIGEDPENHDAWFSTTEHPFYGITDVPAEDGDIDLAKEQSETMLSVRGWRTVGDWRATENAYIIVVQREEDPEEINA